MVTQGLSPKNWSRSKPQISSWMLLGIANSLLIIIAFHSEDPTTFQKMVELTIPSTSPPNVLITQLSNAVATVICKPLHAL